MEYLNNVLVSIILPIYNVEKYLQQCLMSIQKQTYKNIEIILVIDGSRDRSQIIAEDFCKLDKRFKVIYQENMGAGPARNTGIKNSKGTFIIFVDPDDWIAEDFVQVLLAQYSKTKADFILSSGIDMCYDEGGKLKRKIINNVPEIELKNQKDVRTKYLYLYSLNVLSGPAQKLYKREIIEKNNIVFPNLRRSQDIVFNYIYFHIFYIYFFSIIFFLLLFLVH